MAAKKELEAARGMIEADLVLKNATIVNVFTERLQKADIAICGDTIVGIGTYEGMEELDCSGKFIAPGFIDGHIHLESTMLKPVEFARAVLPHGTTGVITDPHEIANVCGTGGIEYMMEATRDLLLDVYLVLPSCVPATSFDESGAILRSGDLKPLYHHPRVVGLGEMMDYVNTIGGEEEICQKISDAECHGKVVDGHAPGLTGKDACAYVLSGIGSDHECSRMEEALEKLSLGQWIMVREGTAAKNLNALLPLFAPPYHQRVIMVSDDKHPNDILRYGHIDDMIRRAVKAGIDPCIAIKTATYNAAAYFGLKKVGAIAPGYKADLVILSDLSKVSIEQVMKNGRLFKGEMTGETVKEPLIPEEIKAKVYHSFHCKEFIPEDFIIKTPVDIHGKAVRVIELVEEEILTKEVRVPITDGLSAVLKHKDIVKLAVLERHHHTNHIGLGLVKGYGLNKGAIASSVSHDSHNLIVIGTNDEDMAAAANWVKEMQGGWAIVAGGRLLGRLPLPIAGLISELDAQTLADRMKEMKTLAKELGVSSGIDPFMTLAFISLPVIPEIRLITTGLIDVCHWKVIPLVAE